MSSKSELVIADILHNLEQRQLIRYSFEKPLTDRSEEDVTLAMPSPI